MLKPKSNQNFKVSGKSKEKKQIILCHTSREVGEYLTSLKFRYNGSYDKIPNFVVSKTGEVIQLIDESGFTKFHGDSSCAKQQEGYALTNLMFNFPFRKVLLLKGN